MTWRHAKLLVCIALAGVGSSCRSAYCEGRWVPQVFRDFVYVGEFPDDQRFPIPTHGQDAQRLPTRFTKARAYVFHSAGAVSTETVAIRELPNRLRLAGVAVSGAPRNAGEFGIPNSGGPIWRIDFKYDGCSGAIYNTVDQELYRDRRSWPDGSREDYVLVFLRSQ